MDDKDAPGSGYPNEGKCATAACAFDLPIQPPYIDMRSEEEIDCALCEQNCGMAGAMVLPGPLLPMTAQEAAEWILWYGAGQGLCDILCESRCNKCE
ncbi:MAG: hypothetical protein AMJ69_10140 [Gammaproteobacteria bacterium SG8_47]|nr:MAG: hypothetical protein AMJ69_10140 [Gammaproteobacteria bacterium SG8_47]